MDVNQIAEEFFKCKQSFEYFLNNYVVLTEPGTGDIVNFKTYDCQRRYLEALEEIWTKQEKDGCILLASRQCGKTTLALSTVAWLLIFHDNYNILYMTKDLPLGAATVQEVKDVLDSLPEWMFPGYKKSGAESFVLENKSTFALQASNKKQDGSSTKGRGFRATFIWVDEAAFLHLADHMAAIIPATSKTFKIARDNNLPYGILLTSTPNGTTGQGEEFYNRWKVAVDEPEESAFIPVKIHWSEVPGYDDVWYEKVKKLIKDPRKLNQEYELVFLGGSNSLFEDDEIKELQDERRSTPPLYETKYKDGYIKWWDIPNPNNKYVIGLDTATAVGKDYSTIEVINYDTCEQVCEAKFKCQINDFTFKYAPIILDVLNNKVIVIERTGVGNQTVENLLIKYERFILRDTLETKDFDKAKYGFNMSPMARQLVIDNILDIVKNYKDKLRSFNLRFETSTMETKRNGKIEGTPNDDLIINLGFCFLAMTHGSFNLSKYFGNIDEEYEDQFESLLDRVDLLNGVTDFTGMGFSSDMEEYQYLKNYDKTKKDHLSTWGII